MPTINDIAKEAGVSHGTVSNVLNKTGKVSIEKIQLVENAIKKLGYVPNVQAQRLRQGSPNTIAVILPSLKEAKYIDFFTALQLNFPKSQKSLLVYQTEDIPAEEEVILDNLRASGLAALIVISTLSKECLEKYRSLLHDGVQGLLLTSRYSRMYAAEFDIAEGVAVVSAQGARYFTDSRYIESAQKNLKGFEVVEIGLNNPMMQALKATLDEFGVETLGFEDEYLTVAELNGFEAALPVKFVPLQKEINAFRASKEDWELARMRKAQEITDRAFTEVCTRIHTGMTEKELEAELIYCLYKNGAEGLSFDPIVVSGPNTSMPHGVAGSRVLQDGDFVTMDFGVLYQGYCSDMTRTVALGHATEEMRKVYDTVLRAQLAGIAASHAGATGKSVDGAARDIITEAGYGPYFGHSYGHSLGLEIHEAPNCTPRNENPIPAGAVCSAEPGIYIPGKFGVRIEDVVIFREGGCEVITHSPKELTIL